MPDSAHQPRSPPAHIRLGGGAVTDVVARMFFELWPDAALTEHREEAALILAATRPSTLPLMVFVAEANDKIVGLIEVALRSHADGCDAGRPVGFIEGWYVEPTHRGIGVGGALMQAAEDWARSQGCHELASDTWNDHESSKRVHEVLGFEVVDRCVHFRKCSAMTISSEIDSSKKRARPPPLRT